MFSTTKQELQHLRVVKPLNGFAVYVGYQIGGSQTRLERWTPLIYSLHIVIIYKCNGRNFVYTYHDEMMHCVKVGITIINANCVNCEAETFWSSPDNNGGF